VRQRSAYRRRRGHYGNAANEWLW